MGEELIIPQTPDSLLNIAQIINNNVQTLKDKFAEKKEEEKEQKENQEKIQEENLELNKSFFSRINDWIKTTFGLKFKKIQDKTHKIYEKYILNGKFFNLVIRGFQGLLDRSGGWFFNLLKALFFLAIFDPKGKFLKSILNFILRMVIWFLNIVTKYLPGIISTMIDLVVNIFPPLLKQIINTLFDAFYNMFNEWANRFPKESIMHAILIGIRNIFGEDGILRKFLLAVADVSPSLIAMLGVLATISKLYPLFKGLHFLLIKFIWPVLTALWTTLKVVFVKLIWPLIGTIATILGLPAWLVAAIIAAIVAIVALIYIYWGEIKTFLIKTWETIKKVAIDTWKWVEKLWSKIKKGFYNSVIVPILDFINKIKNFASSVWQGAKEKANEITSNVWNKILEYLGVIQNAVSWIKNKFSEIWTHIKNFFVSGIGKFLDFLGSMGIAFGEGFKLKDIGATGTMALAQVVRESEEGSAEIISKLENRINELRALAAKEGITGASKMDMRELVLALGEKIGKEKTATIITNVVKPRTLNTSNPNK